MMERSPVLALAPRSAWVGDLCASAGLLLSVVSAGLLLSVVSAGLLRCVVSADFLRCVNLLNSRG